MPNASIKLRAARRGASWFPTAGAAVDETAGVHADFNALKSTPACLSSLGAPRRRRLTGLLNPLAEIELAWPLVGNGEDAWPVLEDDDNAGGEQLPLAAEAASGRGDAGKTNGNPELADGELQSFGLSWGCGLLRSILSSWLRQRCALSQYPL